jgi:hypothetical protein
MFYNGFTLLMQIFAGATGYWVGRHYGRDEGERETIQRYRRMQEALGKYTSKW